MKIKTLEDLLADELKDLYSAENQITKALPKMAKNSQSNELRSAFETHLKQTENQVKRLEKACSDLGISPKGKKCAGMEGLLEEGKEIMMNGSDPETMEAGMIGAAQKVEHYEIAAYGTVIAHARQLGYNSVAEILNQTLAEEKRTDEKLTEIAKNQINVQAAMER
jgi:ferritin-like metal-binding protein YciE